MSLRSRAHTVGAIVGNHMLDRADAMVHELRIRPRLRDDVRQEIVLAELEGRDPTIAAALFVDDDRCLGVTGGGARPTVWRFTPEEMRHIPALGTHAPPEDAGADATKLEVAGAVLVRLSRRNRTIIRLTAQGWTEAEIAAQLGVSQPAVSKALARVRRRSHEMLTKIRYQSCT